MADCLLCKCRDCCERDCAAKAEAGRSWGNRRPFLKLNASKVSVLFSRKIHCTEFSSGEKWSECKKHFREASFFERENKNQNLLQFPFFFQIFTFRKIIKERDRMETKFATDLLLSCDLAILRSCDSDPHFLSVLLWPYDDAIMQRLHLRSLSSAISRSPSAFSENSEADNAKQETQEKQEKTYRLMVSTKQCFG